MDVPDGLISLRQSFPDVRIAAGERNMTRWGFREWLEGGAVDVVQPDIAHAGGISELMRIASYAEVYNVTVAPHNPYGPVALAAAAHAAAAMPNFLILEYRIDSRGPARQLIRKPLDLVDGHVQIPETPGLGIELNEEAFPDHPLANWHRAFIREADGNIGYQ